MTATMFANAQETNFINRTFENWTDTAIYSIDEWYATNYTRSTDAYDGSYALELYTTERTDGDGGLNTSRGYLANYNIFENDQYGGTWYEMEPLALSAWINFTPANGDSARIDVSFYQDQAWVAGEGTYIHATSGYEEIILPLSFTTAPDTVRLYVASGENPGSTILVDNLDLTFDPTSTGEIEQNKFSVYPNPNNGQFTLNSMGASFKIYNVLGIEVQNATISNIQTNINLLGHNSGVYFITVFDADGQIIDTKKLMIK